MTGLERRAVMLPFLDSYRTLCASCHLSQSVVFSLTYGARRKMSSTARLKSSSVEVAQVRPGVLD